MHSISIRLLENFSGSLKLTHGHFLGYVFKVHFDEKCTILGNIAKKLQCLLFRPRISAFGKQTLHIDARSIAKDYAHRMVGIAHLYDS